MKIRSSFVSNSSSSSFIAIVTKSIFEEALTQLKDERHRKVLRGVCNKKLFCGVPIVVVQEMSDSGGMSSLFGEGNDFDYEAMGLTDEDFAENEEGDYFSASDALYEYQNVLDKLAKNKDKKGGILILDDMGSG